MVDNDVRPNPDELLRLIQKEEKNEKRGKLKIFFGMCAGVREDLCHASVCSYPEK